MADNATADDALGVGALLMMWLNRLPHAPIPNRFLEETIKITGSVDDTSHELLELVNGCVAI